MKRWWHLSTTVEKSSKYERSQIWSGRAQMLAAMVSVIAVCIAIVVARQGQETVNNNSQTALRQAEDNQLSTAITALGSSDVAERTAGVLLLTQNVSSRFKLTAETGETSTSVYSNYVTALEIFSGYIRGHGEDFLSGTSAGPMAQQFGPGHGTPPVTTLGDIPIDINYAADQLINLMQLKGDVVALKSGQPSIDLSNDELYQQYWEGINFTWIIAFMPGIDLRGADLRSSQWGNTSDLQGAYLQCADLEGEDFRGTDLSRADLRGANVQGADFRGAKMTETQITQLYGSAKWPRGLHGITALPVQGWNQAACLQNSQFWDYPQTVTPVSPSSSTST